MNLVSSGPATAEVVLTLGLPPWNLTLTCDPREYEAFGRVITFPKFDPIGTLSKTTPVRSESAIFVRSGGAPADGGAVAGGDSDR